MKLTLLILSSSGSGLGSILVNSNSFAEVLKLGPGHDAKFDYHQIQYFLKLQIPNDSNHDLQVQAQRPQKSQKVKASGHGLWAIH